MSASLSPTASKVSSPGSDTAAARSTSAPPSVDNTLGLMPLPLRARYLLRGAAPHGGALPQGPTLQAALRLALVPVSVKLKKDGCCSHAEHSKDLVVAKGSGLQAHAEQQAATGKQADAGHQAHAGHQHHAGDTAAACTHGHHGAHSCSGAPATAGAPAATLVAKTHGSPVRPKAHHHAGSAGFTSELPNNDFDEMPRCCQQAIDFDEPMGAFKVFDRQQHVGQAVPGHGHGAGCIAGMSRFDIMVNGLTGWGALMGLYFGLQNARHAATIERAIAAQQQEVTAQLSGVLALMRQGAPAETIPEVNSAATWQPSPALRQALQPQWQRLKNLLARQQRLEVGLGWQKFVRVFEGYAPVVSSSLMLAGLWFPLLGLLGTMGLGVYCWSHTVRYLATDAVRCQGTLGSARLPDQPVAQTGRRVAALKQGQRRFIFGSTAAFFGLYGAGAALFVGGVVFGSLALMGAAVLPFIVGVAAVTWLNNISIRGAYINNQDRFLDAEHLGNRASVLRTLAGHAGVQGNLKAFAKNCGCTQPWWEKLYYGTGSVLAYLLTFGALAPRVAQAGHARRVKRYAQVEPLALTAFVRQASTTLHGGWTEELEQLRVHKGVPDHGRSKDAAGMQWQLYNNLRQTVPVSRATARPEQVVHVLWSYFAAQDVLEETLLPALANRLESQGNLKGAWWSVNAGHPVLNLKDWRTALCQNDTQALAQYQLFCAEVTHHLLHVEGPRLERLGGSLIDHLTALRTMRNRRKPQRLAR
jgi:hypothetical protein